MFTNKYKWVFYVNLIVKYITFEGNESRQKMANVAEFSAIFLFVLFNENCIFYIKLKIDRSLGMGRGRCGGHIIQTIRSIIIINYWKLLR